MENKLSPELKAFYDTELLENVRCELFYAQFAKRQPLPLHNNGKIEWRKWNTFDRVTKLTEGIIPTGQKFGVTTVTGDIITHTSTTGTDDRLELRAYDDIILGATEAFDSLAADVIERMIRDTLLTNANVMYCDNVKLETGEIVNTPVKCAEMAASKTEMSALTEEMICKVVTVMKRNRVPRINGRYYAVVHPSVADGLHACEGWIQAHKYAAPEEMYNGEIGELHGVRFIEDVFAPVLSGVEYKNREGTQTYATYFFGKDSYGIVDPEGGGVEMIIRDKTEKTIPDKSTVGYRMETNGATIIYPERCLRVMSCTPFSSTDEPNTEECESPWKELIAVDGRVKMSVLRGNEREDPNLFVGINGINYLLPKGRTSNIPIAVHDELYRASRAREILDNYIGELSDAQD